MTPGPDDDVTMAEVAEAGRALDALAAIANAPADTANPVPVGPGMELLLALQASTLAAEIERDELRRPVQAASAALDALAEGRGHDIPEVAALAALRTAIDRPPVVTVIDAPRRHPRRRRIAATVALVGIFSAGGVTAAAAASHPGDQLYGLRVAVIGRVDSDPVVSRDVLNEASSTLASTGPSRAVTEKETAKSEQLLSQAASLVPQVTNPAERKQLVARLAALTADLHRRMADPPPLALAAGPGAQPVSSPTPSPSTAPQAAPTPSPSPASTGPAITTRCASRTERRRPSRRAAPARRRDPGPRPR